MNMNLYGHDEQWLMVDCGVTFPKANTSGADGQAITRQAPVQMADPDFIVQRRQSLVGLIITHAHEDHVGAVPYLWPQLQCPIYTTRFTAEVLRRKLSEFDLLNKVTLKVIEVGDRLSLGPFEVEWLPLTHSVPNSNALMIRTFPGNIFHTGDWKLDPDPVVGHGYQQERFEEIAQEGVLAMVCDSTNATVAGHSVSESDLYDGLREQIASAKGRVVVTCFGSNIARLLTLSHIADDTGRYMGLYGRALRNMYHCAQRAQIWPYSAGTVETSHLGYLPRHEVLAVATGSQGEARTALKRLAAHSHPDFELEPGDKVIFSSRAIPGNENAIDRLIEQLKSIQVEVVTASDTSKPIHASGHPCQEELKQMYKWINPKIAIPVHGEDVHMQAHAQLAKACGVRHVLRGHNGDVFMLSSVPGVQRNKVTTGRLGFEKNQLSKLD